MPRKTFYNDDYQRKGGRIHMKVKNLNDNRLALGVLPALFDIFYIWFPAAKLKRKDVFMGFGTSEFMALNECNRSIY